MNIRSSLLTLALTTCAANAAQTTAPELTTEQQDVITTRRNNCMAVVGGGSMATLLAGFALKNDALRGIGIGGLTSTACYALENNKNWIFVWIASGLARIGLANKLHATQPHDIVLNDAELRTAEMGANLTINITAAFDPAQAQALDKAALVNEHQNNMRLTKARLPIRNSSFFASWLSYLGLRYMGRYIENDVKSLQELS